MKGNCVKNMFCYKCGERIGNDAKFCIKCGTRVEKFNEISSTEQMGMATGTDTSEKDYNLNSDSRSANKGIRKRNINVFLVIICVFLSLGIVGIGAFFAINYITEDSYHGIESESGVSSEDDEDKRREKEVMGTDTDEKKDEPENSEIKEESGTDTDKKKEEIENNEINTEESDDTNSEDEATDNESSEVGSKGITEKIENDKSVFSPNEIQEAIDFYDKYASENLPGYDVSLIYVDEDNIPELLIHGSCEADGNIVVTYNDGEFSELQTMRLGLEYIEKENLLLNSDGHMGSYYDLLYSIENHEFVEKAMGTFGGMEEESYTYTWNDVDVTEQVYYENLKKVFSSDKAISTYNMERYRSVREAAEYLSY